MMLWMLTLWAVLLAGLIYKVYSLIDKGFIWLDFAGSIVVLLLIGPLILLSRWIFQTIKK